jgi:hypothetical protein
VAVDADYLRCQLLGLLGEIYCSRIAHVPLV